jgi:hypothetical protein
MLPKFTELYNAKGEDSIIKYYEGLEGVKSVYETILKTLRPKEEYMAITNSESWLNSDEKFFRRFLEKRAKLRVHARILLQDNQVARDFKKLEQNYGEHIKILPKDTTLTTNLIITPRQVVVHQLTPPPMAMVIENANVVKMNREMFEIMWKSI